MKKIYLLATALVFTTGVFAQNAKKIAVSHTKAEITAKNGNTGGNSIAQIAGSIDCVTGYVAGATMNLSFKLNLTNTDAEYVDSLAITFPAGITPVSSPNNPFASDAADPGPDGPEVLNGVSGQTISWGNNDNNWGGIVANNSYTFVINVTIAGGTTGIQTATFHASGDGYGAAPGDLDGTIAINPQPALNIAAIDLMFANTFPNATACGLGIDTMALMIMNTGAATINSNQPVGYSIDGGTPVTQAGMFFNANMQALASIATNDTAYIMFATPVNFSAVGAHVVKAWITTASDPIASDDTISTTITHLPAIAPTQANPYLMNVDSISNATDPFYLANWNIPNVAGAAAWGITATNAYLASAGCFRINETVADSSEDWITTSCIDLVANDAYTLSWEQRMATTKVGTIGAYLGISKSLSDLTGVIIAQDTVTPNNLWAKNSGTFSVVNSGTYYIGIKSYNGDVTGKTDLRLDDLRITVITGGAAGLKSKNTESSVSLFPNPSTGVVTITIAQNHSTVEVLNLLGEAVTAKVIMNEGNNTINLSNLANGSYIVKVSTGTETVCKKVVINQ